MPAFVQAPHPGAQANNHAPTGQLIEVERLKGQNEWTARKRQRNARGDLDPLGGMGGHRERDRGRAVQLGRPDTRKAGVLSAFCKARDIHGVHTDKLNITKKGAHSVRVFHPVQPLARVTTELRTSAIANFVVGDFALLAALVQLKGPGQAATLFCLIAAVMGILWATIGPSGRLRKQTRLAPQPPTDHIQESSGTTTRRTLIGLLPIAAGLAVCLIYIPETAAILAGIPSGIGAGDLWTLAWSRKFETTNGDAILREAPPNPFSGATRTVYTQSTPR